VPSTSAGVDPGLSGAIAILDHTDALHIIDMPTVKVTVSKKLRRQIDVYSLIEALRKIPSVPEIVVVEELHSRPMQSAQSQFSLGGSFYIAQMIGPVLSIPTHLVPPQTWQRAMGVYSDATGNTKPASIRRAQALFPKQAHLFTPVLRKLSADVAGGRADAALMAFYGRAFI
jgi:crossover junction endodeoxyribonuclease RuvC